MVFMTMITLFQVLFFFFLCDIWWVLFTFFSLSLSLFLIFWNFCRRAFSFKKIKTKDVYSSDTFFGRLFFLVFYFFSFRFSLPLKYFVNHFVLGRQTKCCWMKVSQLFVFSTLYCLLSHSMLLSLYHSSCYGLWSFEVVHFCCYSLVYLFTDTFFIFFYFCILWPSVPGQPWPSRRTRKQKTTNIPVMIDCRKCNRTSRRRRM